MSNPNRLRLTTSTGDQLTRRDTAMREVLEVAGGLDALEEALELVGADPIAGTGSFDILLSYLRDPAILKPDKGNPPTLVELARKAGLTRADLLDLLGKRDMALAVFMSRHKHLGKVLDDIGEDAQSRDIPCRNCGTKGAIEPDADAVRLAQAQAEELEKIGIPVPDPTAGLEPQPCGDCNGVGYLRQIGDAQARQLFFKLHGFDKGGAGAAAGLNLNVGVQVNNNGDGKPKQEPVTVKVQRILDGG